MAARRCFNCMNELNGAGTICPACGFDNAHPGQPEHALACGTVLHNRYLIGRMLGQGGFGITYIGYDQKLDIPVCIKEYFPSAAGAMRTQAGHSRVYWSADIKGAELKQGRELFVKEARKAAKVRSLASVVNVWDVFYENDTAYIVMEYISGMTVKEYLMKRGTVMNTAECVPFFIPVIRDLQELHSMGIVHRDISPDNLMIRKDGKLILLDLGAAKDLSKGKGQSSMVVGKRGFSPPEQFTPNTNIGPWTDVYAICATIYWCMTGKTIPDAMDRMMGAPLIFPASIPKYMESVLQHGLALKPEKRIQDMAVLEKELERVLQKISTPGKLEKQNKNKSLARWIIPGVAAAALIIIALHLPDFPSNIKNREAKQITEEVTPEKQDDETPENTVTEPKKNNLDEDSVSNKTPEITRSSDVPMELTDSWEEIIAASNDGTYTEKYRIGDTKELDLGEEGIIHMELVAKDADELADGSGKAPMTWIAVEVINSSHYMNKENNSEGGWPESDMRAWLREDILPLFPENVKTNIKEVIKYSRSGKRGTISSIDTVWIPSYHEVDIADIFVEERGPQYTQVFYVNKDRLKHKIDEYSISKWWIRSDLSGFSFIYVDSDGSMENTDSNNELDVVVGFCL